MKDAVALRLAKHHLDRRVQQFEWVKVIRDIGGVQVQSMPAARIALWARVDGFSVAAVENALVRARTLVKTWAMRETVHLLPSEDFTLFSVALRATRRRCRERLARRGVSPEQAASAVHVVQELLAAGPVTRKELSERAPVRLRKMVKKLGPYPWDEFLKDPSFLTEVCFGPPRGAETTFASPRRWLLANVRIPPVPRAEEELCRRYLRAFGPATPEDFAYWSGFPIGDARAVFDRLSKQIVEVDVDRARAWVLDEDLRTLGGLRPAHSVRLLPNFDAFLLGHKDKSQILDVRHYKRVFSGAGRVAQTVVVDGQVIATWTAKVVRDLLAVDVQPFDRLRPTVKVEIEAEADDLARFLGKSTARVRTR